MKDKFNIRVLCQRCLSEMRLCGYKLQRTDAKEKEDVCSLTHISRPIKRH